MQRLLLAIVVMNVPFHISKHFFRNRTAEDFGSVAGFDISLSTIALALLYFAWFITQSASPERPRYRTRVNLPVILLLLSFALSLIVATDVSLGVYQVWALLQAVLIYVYIGNNLSSREDVLFVVRFLLLGLALESALMLAQAGGLVEGMKTMPEYAESGRISGTIGAPNSAASYLAMIMPMALVLLFAQVRSRDKQLAFAALIMAALALLFTLSRGGWLSFILSLMGVAMLRGRLPWKPLLVIVAVLLLAAIPFAGVITDRLSQDDNGAAATRMTLNTVALRMIEAHPLLGVGANNFPLVMDSYSTFTGEWLYTVHNTYLLIWSEAGAGAVIGFLWFLAATLRKGWKCRRMNDQLLSPIAIGCAAAIVGHMGHMSVDLFREGAPYDLVWILAGLINVVYRLGLRPAREYA